MLEIYSNKIDEIFAYRGASITDIISGNIALPKQLTNEETNGIRGLNGLGYIEKYFIDGTLYDKVYYHGFTLQDEPFYSGELRCNDSTGGYADETVAGPDMLPKLKRTMQEDRPVYCEELIKPAIKVTVSQIFCHQKGDRDN